MFSILYVTASFTNEGESNLWSNTLYQSWEDKDELLGR
jgi:hypothetical protein